MENVFGAKKQSGGGQIMHEKALQRETKGKFSQIPVVFLDTCDLPEAQQMLFLRLWRETYNGTHTWQGSLRKLAKMARVSIGTAFTAKKKLEEAGLFEVDHLPNEQNNADSIVIRIKSKELWAINEYYCSGGKVEMWKVLPPLEGVQNLNRGCSENETGGVPEFEQECSKSEHQQAQGCSKLEQGVFNSHAQNAPLYYVGRDRDTTNVEKVIDSKANASDGPTSHETERENKAARTHQQVELNPEEQDFYSLYCQMWYVASPPKIDEKVKQQCATLAKHVKTLEQLKTLDQIAHEMLPKGAKHKIIYLGNLINALNGWLQMQPSQTIAEAIPIADEEKTVIWSKTPHQKYSEALEYWYLYERMTIPEARNYGWDDDFIPLTPIISNQIESKLKKLSKGEITLPPHALVTSVA